MRDNLANVLARKVARGIITHQDRVVALRLHNARMAEVHAYAKNRDHRKGRA